MSRFKKALISITLIGLLLPVASFAQNKLPSERFGEALQSGGLVTNAKNVPKVEDAVGTFINSLLILVGVATFALVVYAGGLWIMARGNDTEVAKAKAILQGAVIGLLIVFSAFILVNFVLTQLGRVTGA